MLDILAHLDALISVYTQMYSALSSGQGKASVFVDLSLVISFFLPLISWQSASGFLFLTSTLTFGWHSRVEFGFSAMTDTVWTSVMSKNTQVPMESERDTPVLFLVFGS